MSLDKLGDLLLQAVKVMFASVVPDDLNKAEPLLLILHRMVTDVYHLAHGTSQLHTLVRSLCFLHHFRRAALGGVNRIVAYTLVCNLYIYIYSA